jgi:hypothetical protein
MLGGIDVAGEVLSQSDIDKILAGFEKQILDDAINNSKDNEHIFICRYCKKKMTLTNGCKKKTPINYVFTNSSQCKNPYGHSYISKEYLESLKRD